jgi:hypothetical protein
MTLKMLMTRHLLVSRVVLLEDEHPSVVSRQQLGLLIALCSHHQYSEMTVSLTTEMNEAIELENAEMEQQQGAEEEMLTTVETTVEKRRRTKTLE